MTLQSIAHHVVPASLRDIGTGVYHLAKRDATEEHCQKLVTGAIRVALAASTALAVIAATALLPEGLGFFVGFVINLGSYCSDTETSFLTVGSLMTVTGMSGVALSANLIAQKLFVPGVIGLIFGSAITGGGWFVTRIPKDIEFDSGFDVLKDKIDNLGDDWGSQLHHSVTKHFAWNA